MDEFAMRAFSKFVVRFSFILASAYFLFSTHLIRDAIDLFSNPSAAVRFHNVEYIVYFALRVVLLVGAIVSVYGYFEDFLTYRKAKRIVEEKYPLDNKK